MDIENKGHLASLVSAVLSIGPTEREKMLNFVSEQTKDASVGWKIGITVLMALVYSPAVQNGVLIIALRFLLHH